MNFILSILPLFLVLGFNAIFGIIAVNMAKKRDLNTVPAFWGGFFGSFVTLFIIAMIPIKNDEFY